MKFEKKWGFLKKNLQSKWGFLLNVSVDYLLGLEDDLGVKEYAPADAAPGATERAMGDEAELLRAFRKLSPFARSAVMVQVKALAEDQEELPVK